MSEEYDPETKEFFRNIQTTGKFVKILVANKFPFFALGHKEWTDEQFKKYMLDWDLGENTQEEADVFYSEMPNGVVTEVTSLDQIPENQRDWEPFLLGDFDDLLEGGFTVQHIIEIFQEKL